MDLLPTSLELAGVPAKSLPGESLSYLWTGKKPSTKTYFWEHEGNKALRKGNWKLVKDFEDPSWELYDLSTDICETKNLATTQVKVLNEMLAEYAVWSNKVGVKEFTKSQNKSE